MNFSGKKSVLFFSAPELACHIFAFLRDQGCFEIFKNQ